MVGTWGLEPQTSTVSILRYNFYNPLAALLFRFSTTPKNSLKLPVFGDELVTSFAKAKVKDCATFVASRLSAQVKPEERLRLAIKRHT